MHQTVFESNRPAAKIVADSLRDTKFECYWIDDVADSVARYPELTGNQVVDDAVVGGGFAGLWTAIKLKTEHPDHRVVLLTVQPHVVGGRIGGADRPLLAGEDSVSRWNRIYEERRPVYEDVADLALDTSTGPMADIVTRIVAWARADAPAPASTEEES